MMMPTGTPIKRPISRTETAGSDYLGIHTCMTSTLGTDESTPGVRESGKRRIFFHPGIRRVIETTEVHEVHTAIRDIKNMKKTIVEFVEPKIHYFEINIRC